MCNENEEKYYCPCCGEDVTELIRKEVSRRSRVRNMKRVNSEMSEEAKAKRNREGGERFKKWREENPEKAAEGARHASQARTKESHQKQGETLRENNRRRMVIFAELLFAAKQQGREITPELEAELLRETRSVIKSKK